MKTYLTYGFGQTLTLALVTLALFFLGFHSDAEKMVIAGKIGTWGGFAIAIVATVLGIKARRADVPPTEEFGYGSALLAGFLIGLFAALFSIVTNYFYMHVINPGFTDVLIQTKVNEWEAAGASSDRIEKGQEMMRSIMTNAALQAVFVFGFTLCLNTLISLVAAAFLKREAIEETPLSS